MDDLRQETLRKLNGIVLYNTCISLASECDYFHYDSALDSGSSIVRFSTDQTDFIFNKKKCHGGPWKNHATAMYEIVNIVPETLIKLMVHASFFSFGQLSLDPILHHGDLNEDERGLVCLACFDLSVLYPNVSLQEALERFVKEMLPQYEQKLSSWAYEVMPSLKEGEINHVELDKYERNPAARKACLEAHGHACMICGFDFGKVYGEEFEGKIEVHHIVPISAFEGEHKVDPIKDLIPVCPNCHLALHSKPGGVYTPDELKRKLKQ